MKRAKAMTDPITTTTADEFKEAADQMIHLTKWASERNRQTIISTGSERVVMIHCSGSSRRQWKPLTEQLAGFQTKPLDLFGHGEQGRWHGIGPLSLAEEAGAIREACSESSAPFHLVGHSYGGAVALRFALSFPERLRSLTLIEPSCFHILNTTKEKDARLLDQIRLVADAVNRGVICGDYQSGMKTFIDYWGGAGSWQNLPDSKKIQFSLLALHVAHHFWNLFEEQTPLSAYADLDVPTLILCGERSPHPSWAITRILADTLPRARHHTIHNAGHMSPITHPDEVNPLVLEHLLLNGEPTDKGPRVHGGQLASCRRASARVA